jgi:hypothetical protein
LNEEEDQEKKELTAKGIAAIMVENMKKNMEDPDFLYKKEMRLQEAADKVIKKREERRKKSKKEDFNSSDN